MCTGASVVALNPKGPTCGRDGVGGVHGLAGGADGEAQRPGGGALQQDDEPELEERRRRGAQPRLLECRPISELTLDWCPIRWTGYQGGSGGSGGAKALDGCKV